MPNAELAIVVWPINSYLRTSMSSMVYYVSFCGIAMSTNEQNKIIHFYYYLI